MRKKDYATINKNVYNEVAKDLKERHKFLRRNEPHPKDYYEKIMHYLSKNENISYLELGPGDGNVLKFFANKNINTYAIENTEEMIALCRKNSPKTTLIEDNILNANFNNNSFDIIFAGSFIHLFPKEDLKVVMEKIYNWLNNGGIFFAYTTMHQKDEEGYFSKDKSNYKNENNRFRHKFTKESLSNLLNDYNFKILEHYDISEPEKNRIWQFTVSKKE